MECFKQYEVRCGSCGRVYILSFNFDDLNDWVVFGGEISVHLNYLNKFELNLLENNHDGCAIIPS